MRTTTRPDYQTTMEERLARAGAVLDRLSSTARDLGGAVRDELQDMVRQLQREQATLAEKLGELRVLDDEAWEDYLHSVEQAQKRFDTDVVLAEAELRRRRAATRHEFADAVDAELRAWWTRIDELRVQAELARMDTQDELEPLLAAMRHRRSDLEERLGDLRGASEETWESIREDITRRFAQLRQSLGDVNQRLSD